jgi:hypothetical protein
MINRSFWQCAQNRKLIKMCAALSTLVITVCLFASFARSADDLPAEAKVLDPDILFYSDPNPIVSPDGKWIAYISKGFVCVCNIDDPHPRQLVEVPHSRTHLLAQPEYADARDDPRILWQRLGREGMEQFEKSVTQTIVGLQWTREGDAVVFGLNSFDAEKKELICEVKLASLKGKITTLAHIRDGGVYTHLDGMSMLSRDRKFIVLSGYVRPLIWDLTTDKPRATPFMNLVPSATSDRWLGVEKDTRQLVVTDASFQVIKRFENEWPKPRSYGRDLLWSPDERFVIWKNQVGFDYDSNWEGGWIDLQTGKQESMTGSYMAEIVRFTGHDSEFMRIGSEGKPWANGMLPTDFRFQFFTSGNAKPEDVWSVHFDPNDRTIRRECPDIRFIYFSSDYKYFAFGLPRPNQPPAGEIFHLMDRTGHLWKLPGKDNGEYFSPYEVVGFVDNGKSIIAHDSRRLFAIPISAVMSDANASKRSD